MDLFFFPCIEELIKISVPYFHIFSSFSVQHILGFFYITFFFISKELKWSAAQKNTILTEHLLKLG